VSRRVPIGAALAIASAVVFAVPCDAAAQGAVAGRVHAAGTPVAAARVEVEAAGLVVAVTTDADGRFAFNELRPGRHTLRIAAAGFRIHSVEIISGPAPVSIEVALTPIVLRHDEQLQVTASRTERRTTDLPFATTVVDADELGRRQPRSTPEALMDAPGVLLQKTNHGSGSPYVRGLLGNQVLVLVDGIRLNNSTFRFGPNQYLSTIDPGQIDRIEIVRGAGAVLYGSDAIGGVVNIITKRPGLTSQPTGLQGSATARVVSSGMEQSGRVELESASSIFAVRGGLSLRNFGDLRAGGSLGTEAPSGYREGGGDVSAQVRVTDRSELRFSYQHLHQDDVPRFDQVTQRGFARYSFAPQSRQLAAATFRQVPAAGPIRRIESTLSFHRSFERRDLQRAGASTRTIEEDIVRTLGASVQAHFAPWRTWRLHTGLDFYRDRIGSSRRDEVIATGVSTSRRGLYPDGASASSLAGFAYVTRSWTRTSVEGGVRYSRFDISASDATFGAIELDADAWTGQVGATHQLTSRLQLVGSISQSFRAPNVDDVSTLGLFDSGIEVPSPNLVPERAWSAEGGARLRGGRGVISGVLFRTNLRDLIDRVRSTFDGSAFYEGQPVFQKANVQKAYVYGTEFEGQWLPRASVMVFGHASYTFGHQPLSNQPMRRIPPLHGLMGARWTQSGTGLWIEGRVRGADKQTRLSSGDRSDHRIDPNGTPGWIVASFGAGRPIGDRFEIVGGIENLFDEAYRVHGSGIDGMGRSAWIGIRLAAGRK
jgi:hemoglobin/transferrin/lactoferrin receptor protein